MAVQTPGPQRRFTISRPLCVSVDSLLRCLRCSVLLRSPTSKEARLISNSDSLTDGCLSAGSESSTSLSPSVKTVHPSIHPCMYGWMDGWMEHRTISQNHIPPSLPRAWNGSVGSHLIPTSESSVQTSLNSCLINPLKNILPTLAYGLIESPAARCRHRRYRSVIGLCLRRGRQMSKGTPTRVPVHSPRHQQR